MHWLFPWLLWQAILFNFLLLRITCTNCHNSSLFLTLSFSWSRIYFILLSAEWTHSLLTHILPRSELCEDYQTYLSTSPQKRAQDLCEPFCHSWFFSTIKYGYLQLLSSFALLLHRCWVPPCAFFIYQQGVLTATKNTQVTNTLDKSYLKGTVMMCRKIEWHYLHSAS